MFLRGPCWGVISKGQSLGVGLKEPGAKANWSAVNRQSWSNSDFVRQFCTGGCEERTWAREAEESPLLEAVTREGLVKTQQAGKGLASAVVICEL
jgi:hypothetical protein